jgi:hypothetical protein
VIAGDDCRRDEGKDHNELDPGGSHDEEQESQETERNRGSNRADDDGAGIPAPVSCAQVPMAMPANSGSANTARLNNSQQSAAIPTNVARMAMMIMAVISVHSLDGVAPTTTSTAQI